MSTINNMTIATCAKVVMLLCITLTVTNHKSTHWKMQVAYADHLQYLPQQVNVTKFIHDLYDVVENMKDTESSDIDLQEYIRKMLLLAWRLPYIDVSELHRYDSHQEKLISGGPKANSDECNRKLRFLIERITLLQSDGSSLVEQSTDYRLFNLLDSFGRPEGSFLRGAFNWLGDYDQCLKALYNYKNNDDNDDDEKLSGSRYCLAHVRWQKWTNTPGMNEWAQLAIKSAVCLPDSCDSNSAELKENKQMISKLMEINYSPAYKNFQIGTIYCLPDSQSPLTQFWHDPPALYWAIFFVSWIVIIIATTVVDLYKRTRKESSKEVSPRSFDLVELFSFAANIDRLFEGTCASSKKDRISEQQDQNNLQLKAISSSANQGIIFNKTTNNKMEANLDVGEVDHRSRKTSKVSLKYLHCVKVITIFVVMRCHYIMAQTNLTRIYDISQWFNRFDVFHLAFAGMAVNVFLMITGLLIAYVIFERFPPFYHQSNNDKHKQHLADDLSDEPAIVIPLSSSRQHPLFQPTVWLAFCSDRYLKIVPIWALVTLFPRYFYKYWDSGPMMSYGTSNSTNSYQCQQQKWLHLFLGITNLRPVYYNCIGSEWYLAINLQCALVVTPLIIMAYVKAPRITFAFTMILPFAQFFHYLLSDVYIPDYMRDMTRYDVTSVATFAVFLHELGNTYHYSPIRLVYFISGISVGYMLHIYESVPTEKNAQLQFMRNIVDFLRKPIISNWYTWLTMFLLIFIPAWLVPHLPARFALIFNTAASHICTGFGGFSYTYIVPVLLVQLSTGSIGNSLFSRRFLNSSIWLPFSRISVSFLLADPLINGWFNLRNEKTVHLSLDLRISQMIGYTVIIYIISFVLYLGFESPIKTLLKLIQNRLMRKYANKQKPLRLPK